MTCCCRTRRKKSATHTRALCLSEAAYTARLKTRLPGANGIALSDNIECFAETMSMLNSAVGIRMKVHFCSLCTRIQRERWKPVFADWKRARFPLCRRLMLRHLCYTRRCIFHSHNLEIYSVAAWLNEVPTH